MRSGRPFPPWDDRPRLPIRLHWVWQAFQELQTCRPIGMGVGPIPWTAIAEYVREKEVLEPERFEHLIRALDLVQLRQMREERDER